MIISGGEDTYVKVSIFENGVFKLLQTFSNHVASVRAISKLKISDGHLIVTAGSRLQANVYRLKDESLSHVCHFMRSFEQNSND